MLYAAEQLNPIGYTKAPAVDGVNIRIHETVARQLGLRDGQVIQAVVEARGETSRLVLGGQSLALPNALKFANGDAPYFRVLPAAGGGKVLHLVRVGEPPSSAGPAAASANALSGRLLDLLARPVDAGPVAQALRAPEVQRLLADPSLKPALAMLAKLQFSMGFLDGEAIRRAVAQSGLWTEARLARGQVPEPDLKQWLRYLLRLTPQGDNATAGILAAAVDAIETQQLDLLRAQGQREALFSVLLPFFDAGPVELKFSRGHRLEREREAPFIVNAHIQSPTAGGLWLKAVLTLPVGLSVTVWSESNEVAAAAQAAEARLRASLADRGLVLKHFAVFNTTRPEPPERLAAPGRLIDVDC